MKIHVTVEFFKDTVEDVRTFTNPDEANRIAKEKGEYDETSCTGVKVFETELEVGRARTF